MTDDLISKIVDELTDPEYSGKTHGCRTTYKTGCKGPLCLKSERDRSNRKRANKNPDRRPRTQSAELDAFLEQVIKALGLHPKRRGGGLAQEIHRAVGASQTQAA